MNYEKEILKYCYDNFGNYNSFWIPLDEIISKSPLKHEPLNEIKFWIIELEKKGMVRRIVIPTSGEKLELFLEGFLYYEEFYSNSEKEYTNLTVSILDIFRNIEQNKIGLEPGEGSQRGIISIKSVRQLLNNKIEEKFEKQIIFIVHHLSPNYIRTNSCGYSGKKGFIFFGNDPILTGKGRDLLNKFQKLSNLFSNIKEVFAREVLLEEYNDISFLLKNEKWKDVAIKMGSILDYLTYQYFINQNLKIPDNNFHNRLLYIQKNSSLGDSNDWFRADNILRHYRNFIHLNELIERKFIFDKNTINLLIPIFERLILLF